ncbi:MAG: hypothetical protein Q9218_002335 [Villophora microphyllina]
MPIPLDPDRISPFASYLIAIFGSLFVFTWLAMIIYVLSSQHHNITMISWQTEFAGIMREVDGEAEEPSESKEYRGSDTMIFRGYRTFEGSMSDIDKGPRLMGKSVVVDHIIYTGELSGSSLMKLEKLGANRPHYNSATP